MFGNMPPDLPIYIESTSIFLLLIVVLTAGSVVQRGYTITHKKLRNTKKWKKVNNVVSV